MMKIGRSPMTDFRCFMASRTAAVMSSAMVYFSALGAVPWPGMRRPTHMGAGVAHHRAEAAQAVGAVGIAVQQKHAEGGVRVGRYSKVRFQLGVQMSGIGTGCLRV